MKTEPCSCRKHLTLKARFALAKEHWGLFKETLRDHERVLHTACAIRPIDPDDPLSPYKVPDAVKIIREQATANYSELAAKIAHTQANLGSLKDHVTHP